MESWLGGGVLLLVAAALWLVYLVPNWLRRSEYLATERNAVRLQQTIRVLAETAEAPEAVRIENAAKARKAVAEALAARPVAVGTAPSLPLPEELDPRVRAARRLRRTRLAVTLVMAAGLVALGWQLLLMLQGGMAAGSAMIVAVAGLVVLGGAGLQGRLARAAKARWASVPQTDRPAHRPLSERSRSLSERSETKRPHEGRASESLDLASDTAVPEDRAWTPQQLPQPLARVRREAAITAARAEAVRIAAAGNEETARSVAAARALDAERRPAPMPPIEEPRSGRAPLAEESRSGRDLLVEEPRSGVSKPAPETPRLSPKIASPFAAMGVVNLPAGTPLDLDGALARRRAS